MLLRLPLPPLCLPLMLVGRSLLGVAGVVLLLPLPAAFLVPALLMLPAVLTGWLINVMTWALCPVTPMPPTPPLTPPVELVAVVSLTPPSLLSRVLTSVG